MAETTDELIICGWDEVFILDLRGEPRQRPAKIWSWRAAGSPGMPDGLRSRFGTTDECKPLEGGRRILITSSGGAVALVERATGRTLFAAAAANAHSAEVLPDGRVAVAASTAPAGNALILFDPEKPEAPVWRDPLPAAHGVVWDRARKVLWALGNTELRAYHVRGAEGLVLDRTVALPEGGGHDLFPLPDGRRLTVSTSKHVWVFDAETRALTPHPELGDVEQVKSLCVHPQTGRLVYTQAEAPNWWTEHIRFRNPEGVLRLPGERLYKARWMASTGASG